MPRWIDPEERKIQLIATLKLVSAIRIACEHRKISTPEIEEVLCIGSLDERTGKKSGKQFKRWCNGKHPMSADLRQRVMAKAIKLGWIVPYKYDWDLGKNILVEVVKSAPPKDLLDGQALSDRVKAMVDEHQTWEQVRSALLSALRDFSAFQPIYGSPSGLVNRYAEEWRDGTEWDLADADKDRLTKEIQSITETLARLDEYEWAGLSEAIGWQLPKLSVRAKKAQSGANRVQSSSPTKTKRVQVSPKKVKSEQ